jgi:hypothetical protein
MLCQTGPWLAPSISCTDITFHVTSQITNAKKLKKISLPEPHLRQLFKLDYSSSYTKDCPQRRSPTKEQCDLALNPKPTTKRHGTQHCNIPTQKTQNKSQEKKTNLGKPGHLRSNGGLISAGLLLWLAPLTSSGSGGSITRHPPTLYTEKKNPQIPRKPKKSEEVCRELENDLVRPMGNADGRVRE